MHQDLLLITLTTKMNQLWTPLMLNYRHHRTIYPSPLFPSESRLSLPPTPGKAPVVFEAIKHGLVNILCCDIGLMNRLEETCANSN